MNKRILIFGETSVGKTTFLATVFGNMEIRERLLPNIDMNDKETNDAITLQNQNYSTICRNCGLPGTVKEYVHWKFKTLNHTLEVVDIRGTLVRNLTDEVLRKQISDADAIILCLALYSDDLNDQIVALKAAGPHLQGKYVSIVLTKCESELDQGSHEWNPSDDRWKQYREMLGRTVNDVIPVSSYGYDNDTGRPACLLGEFGELIPYRISPKNVILPFKLILTKFGFYDE